MFDDKHSLGLGGPPHEDHQRRCQGIRYCGVQCRRWAIRGSNFCQFHGGRRSPKYWSQHVSRFYKRALTQTLTDALQQSLELKPDDQFNLMEELALMRQVASQYVTVYGAALESGKQDLILSSGELMALALNQVANICKLAASVHSEQKDKFSIHDLNYVIEQIIRISYDCFKDDDRCNKFAMMIRDQLDIRSKAQGTTITADQAVRDMDALSMGDDE
jgi:hypothetical protein